MKNNQKNWIFNRFNAVLLAIATITMTATTVTYAQSDFRVVDCLSIPDEITNGLFTPTQADRFFQAGTEDFEREVEIFIHPEHYQTEDLLQIEAEDSSQVKPQIDDQKPTAN